MRVTNAKKTGPNAQPSTRIAKRAVLVALIVATASHASGQQPSGGLINSRYNNSAPAPRIVRQGAKVTATPTVGDVRSNPFFAGQPRKSLTAAVQLASGDGPNVRLKNSGRAIGFQTIGGQVQPQQAAATPQTGATPQAVTQPQGLTQPGRGQVQPNGHVNAFEQQTQLDKQANAGNAFANQNPATQSPVAARSVSETPLIQSSATPFVPAAPAEAFDRFAPQPAAAGSPVPAAGNAFANQLQQGEIQLTQTPGGPDSNLSPVPLAIRPNSATPIESISSAATEMDPRFKPAPQSVSHIPQSAQRSSRVVPVVDARDEQEEIKETQPIFFSFTDESAEPVKPSDAEVAGDVTLLKKSSKPKIPVVQPGNVTQPKPVIRSLSDVELPVATEPGTQEAGTQDDGLAEDSATKTSAAKHQDPKTPGLNADAAQTGSDLSPKAPANVEAESKTVDVETESSNKTPSDSSEGLETTGEADDDASPLSTVDSPVQLAPVLNFAEKIPSPLSPIVNEQPVVRLNPKMDEPELDSDAIEDLVSRGAIAGKSIRPKVQAPVQVTIKSNEPDTPLVSRKAVAVAMPPLKIERTGHDGSAMEPTVGAVTHDPSQSIALAPSPGAEQLQKDEDQAVQESLSDAVQALTETVASVPKLPTVSVVDESGPDFESQPIGRAPVFVDPAGAAPNAVVEMDSPQTRLAIPPRLKSNRTQASLVSSKQNLRHGSTDSDRGFGQSPVGRPVVSSPVTQDPVAPSPNAKSKNVQLQLSRAQVRSMTIGGQLRRVSISNKEVCQAFASGANQIKLIGTGIGTTQLTVWADVASGEPTRVQTFDIDVSEAVNATGDKVSENTELLNDSIDNAFPRASVVVSRQGGELIVTGRCDSETDAKQIIRMVRKSCLVPVRDNLKVR